MDIARTGLKKIDEADTKQATEKLVTPNKEVQIVKEIETALPSLYGAYKGLVTPSEVPMEYHPFTFMGMVSAFAGDRVYFEEGLDVIYPNLWTLTIGWSGVDRKSTSLRPAQHCINVAREMPGEDGGISVNVLASKGSPEGFFTDVAQNKGVGVFFHSELGGLLGGLEKKYMSGLVEELCELYDPVVSGTMRKRLADAGKDWKIDHLAISWQACTTQASLRQRLTAGDDRIVMGFLPRFNVVLGSSIPQEQYQPWRPEIHRDKLNAFVLDLVETIGKTDSHCKDWPSEPVKYGPIAKKAYEEWYMKKRAALDEEPDRTIQAFHVRTLEVVKKYALLVSLAKGANHLAENSGMIDEASMRTALLFGNYFWLTAERLIRCEIPASHDEAERQHVLTVIERRGGEATQETILKYARELDAYRLDRHLETLLARKELVLVDQKETRKSYKRYRLNHATESTDRYRS